ncbi:TetR/AcrR family transcriptional regulator [Streptomyces lydicus]|uniref:TetR/AcrR family transcriptional regulator n=1 Tax=Streptomyces lydicus TaxID=47763 RepID=UPI0037BD3F07
MQTRRYHHGDLRAALLSRAEQTLRERGSGALSLRELARDLGVSHAAPSRHFKDKQALLDALALVGFDRLLEVLTAARDEGSSFTERLGALARAYVGFATANAELLDLMYAVKHDPAASRALLEAVHRAVALAEELIAEGQRTGEVRPGPVDRVSMPVFTTLHGFAGLAVSSMLSPEETEAGLGDVIAYMLRGCAAGGDRN